MTSLAVFFRRWRKVITFVWTNPVLVIENWNLKVDQFLFLYSCASKVVESIDNHLKQANQEFSIKKWNKISGFQILAVHDWNKATFPFGKCTKNEIKINLKKNLSKTSLGNVQFFTKFYWVTIQLFVQFKFKTLIHVSIFFVKHIKISFKLRFSKLRRAINASKLSK